MHGAKKLIFQYATTSDEPVVLLDLWLIIDTFRVEKMSLLLIESSLRCEKDGGDQQMMPEPLNTVFSVEATWQKPCRSRGNRYGQTERLQWPYGACTKVYNDKYTLHTYYIMHLSMWSPTTPLTGHMGGYRGFDEFINQLPLLGAASFCQLLHPLHHRTRDNKGIWYTSAQVLHSITIQ